MKRLGIVNRYVVVAHWEKAMATHSSTLAWKIPWTEEPGRLQSMGSLRVRHDWATSLSLSTHALEKEMATPSSVLAWRIPWTEKPGGLQSMGSHRVGDDWSDAAKLLIIVLIFISLVTNTVEHLFMFHLPSVFLLSVSESFTCF